MSLQRGEQEQSLRLSPLRNRSVPVARANACHPTHRFAIEQVPGSDSSNPTASTGVDRCQTGDTQTPSVLATRATRKTTRISTRDAKCNAAFGHAPSQHGRYRTPKQLARDAKNPKQPREWRVESRAVLRTGQEPNLLMFFQCF